MLVHNEEVEIDEVGAPVLGLPQRHRVDGVEEVAVVGVRQEGRRRPDKIRAVGALLQERCVSDTALGRRREHNGALQPLGCPALEHGAAARGRNHLCKGRDGEAEERRVSRSNRRVGSAGRDRTGEHLCFHPHPPS